MILKQNTGSWNEEKSFDDLFFDFSDRPYFWATVYRFILFMDLEKETQLMLGIGQKNVKLYRINNVVTNFEGNSQRFKTGVTYWCTAGNFVHRTKNEWIENGQLNAKSDTFVFEKTGDAYRLSIKEIETDVEIPDSGDIDLLGFKFIFSPFYRANKYARYHGRINGERSKGIVFMQKVWLDMPFIPWKWGLTFFENGTRMDFYDPRTVVPFFKSLNLYHEGKHYRFEKNMKIEKMEKIEKSGDGLPLWRASGKTRHGEELSIEIESYAHARNTFETRRSCFIYNEYPSRLTDFTFKRKGETITMDDLGKNATNCEDAYYSKVW